MFEGKLSKEQISALIALAQEKTKEGPNMTVAMAPIISALLQFKPEEKETDG